MKPLLEMHDIKLKFGEKEILAGVDLSVMPKEVLVVMGKSGGGKSTLVSIILRLLNATSGTVTFKGEELTALPRRELNRLRTQIGMVFQNAALISSMTVGENLALPLEELSDRKPEEIAKAVEEKLKMVDLSEAKDKLPAELSGGMKKRVALARALMLDPELMLFDEPSAGLDPVATKNIDELILDLRDKHGVTSIVITHELDSAFAIATRFAFLDQGKIIFDGDPEKFKASQEPLIREFLEPHFEQKSSTHSAHANPQK